MNNNLLNDRIGRLKEWKQKESLNEILYDTLSSLNEYTQERFDELTKEIRDEAALYDKLPVIKVAVCTEENMDKQLFLHPVSSEAPIGSPGYLTTVFVECDYLTLQKLMSQTYTAKIKLATGELQVQVALRYSLKYLQKLKTLYYTYSENELPWTTVNGIYFYKFLDVYYVQEQAIGEVEDYEIDFTQYEKYISYDKQLVWNINYITMPVTCEAKPTYDTIQYIHTIKDLQLDEHHYLVCPIKEKFRCFRNGQIMYVSTYTKQLEQIRLLRIIGSEDADSPLYLPPKTNQKKAGVMNTLARGKYIPTRGEAERIIYSLDEEKDLRLVDIKILPYTEENLLQYKGIEFNFFIETNSFLPDRKLLLFKFKTNTNKLWAYETMFFILSELQLCFYEYRVVGEIEII